ncbi:MAG TPA: XisI protein [Cyanobacteria bacterium UBA11372]|nr:XisI protein [Cyanobacteria bacterium UBA11372]HBE34792.1 XisI protein [Cyanobacteria bacterium UBA11368]HBE47367.1 XisI protein [Cyanobacteria bacterium UBA11369]
MDRIEQYRQIIKKVITEYHNLNLKSPSSTLESAVVFDEFNDHYLLLTMGWNKDERIKGVTIHVRLNNGKIWIEEDWTEDGVATDLLREGITREEIVLAFHPPQLRQYTEFASA